jgi:anti-sigma B factor antagonist
MLHEWHQTGTPVPGQRAARRATQPATLLTAELVMGEPDAGDLGVWVQDLPDDALVVRVAGEVDMATAKRLRDELTCACARADGQRVVLDLAAVRFLGSAGLRALAEIHQLCRRCELEFVVVNAPRSALRAIQLSGLDRVLSVEPAAPDADP